MRPEKPTCLDDLEMLVQGIIRTGRPAVVNLPITNREDVILRALALLGICWGRDTAMLEAVVGDGELVVPAEHVKFATRQNDGSYIFADRFDQLKSTIFYRMCL